MVEIEKPVPKTPNICPTCFFPKKSFNRLGKIGIHPPYEKPKKNPNSE